MTRVWSREGDSLELDFSLIQADCMTAATSQIYKTYMCLICGYIYDEAEGWPDDGIAAGTRWEDIPAGWCCPECGARKEDFEMVEI